MILWLLLFGLVLSLSFVLAARSMRDFDDIHALGEPYSLFLIRKPKSLNKQLLSSIQDSLKSGQVLSFERLFKGSEAALVIFGPMKLLAGYNSLDLLELEDYTNVNPETISACSVGIKNLDQLKLAPPHLSSQEQFWWQLTLSHQFRVQIKAVLVSDAPQRNIYDVLQNLAPLNLEGAKTKAFSEAQILEAYQKRSLLSEGKKLVISAEEVLQLLLI